MKGNPEKPPRNAEEEAQKVFKIDSKWLFWEGLSASWVGLGVKKRPRAQRRSIDFQDRPEVAQKLPKCSPRVPKLSPRPSRMRSKSIPNSIVEHFSIFLRVSNFKGLSFDFYDFLICEFLDLIFYFSFSVVWICFLF